MEFLELLGRDRRRTLRLEVLAFLGLGERDYVTDIARACEQHDESVDPERISTEQIASARMLHIENIPLGPCTCRATALDGLAPWKL